MRTVVHAYTLSIFSRQNEKLCGVRSGSPLVTGHIEGMTCGRCLRIIRRSKKLTAAYSGKEAR